MAGGGFNVYVKRDQVEEQLRKGGNRRYFSPITYFWADWYNKEESKWLKITRNMPLGFVILNISNGSGAKLDTDFLEQAKRARAAGASILGYVRTDYGRRAQAEIMTEIQNHIDWYQVDGVFLDEGVNGWAEQESLIPGAVKLYEDIKAKHGSGFTVVTNPGSTTVEALIQASDVQMCFESYAEKYLTAEFPNFYAKYPGSKFWHVVHDITERNYLQIVDHAVKLGAAHLYLTDDRFVASEDPQTPSENPYDAVPADYLMKAQRYLGGGLDNLVGDLAAKADRTYVDAKVREAGTGGAAVNLDAKADKSYVDAQLATKAATSALAAKADTTFVNAELTKKAAVATVEAKADKSYVDTELGKKAAVTAVEAKADKAYVDTELGKKANVAAVTAKADTAYVNTELGKKMDKATKVVTNLALAGKVLTISFSDGSSSQITFP